MAVAPLFTSELQFLPAAVFLGLETLLAQLAADLNEFAVAEGTQLVAEGFESILTKANHGKRREEAGRTV